jgi:SAM-dependent methyltransferase
MLDIGCGTGGMVELARLREIQAFGIDGDFTIEYPKGLRNYIYTHDFTEGPCTAIKDKKFDLAWSVEFLEHVEEKYQENYMDAFDKCDYAIVTAAPPGYPGHHHVNCRTEEYWKNVFSLRGFLYDETETDNIRKFVSTMQKPFMQSHGMFFRKSVI